MSAVPYVVACYTYTLESEHMDVLPGITPFIDAAAECERIVEALRTTVHGRFRKRGAVLGLSGGVDSSTVAYLCQRAFGADHVLGVLMPEQDSSPDSARLAYAVADQLSVRTEVIDITSALIGLGCYERRDAAIKRVFPEYDPATYGAKIVLPTNRLDSNHLNFFSVAIVDHQGAERKRRLPVDAYLQIVAASNMKQRVRMLSLYYFAERYDYAVIGTPNKNEHEQGFFVKYGDGGVDIQPIVHLYKTEVYQLAAYLGVPEEIRQRPPTSDTYSTESTQEEFFFGLPFALMDALWHAKEQGMTAEEAATASGLEPAQVQRVWSDLDGKARTTEYLRMPPVQLPPPERDVV
jgi:NAD+ synthase